MIIINSGEGEVGNGAKDNYGNVMFVVMTMVMISLLIIISYFLVKHESKCNLCKVYPIVGFR